MEAYHILISIAGPRRLEDKIIVRNCFWEQEDECSAARSDRTHSAVHLGTR